MFICEGKYMYIYIFWELIKYIEIKCKRYSIYKNNFYSKYCFDKIDRALNCHWHIQNYTEPSCLLRNVLKELTSVYYLSQYIKYWTNSQNIYIIYIYIYIYIYICICIYICIYVYIMYKWINHDQSAIYKLDWEEI